jgi:hypothetical protein
MNCFRRLILFALAVVTLTAKAGPSNTLDLVRTIPLPDVAGRIDHLGADPERHRLYVAALGNDTVEVLDLQEGKRLETIRGCAKPQGILFLRKPNLLYVTGGGEGQVKIYDCDSFRPIKTIGPLPDADNIRLDVPSNRVYVGYGEGALGVINAMTGVQTYSIKLQGHPESFQIERLGGRIFVNVPSAGHIAVVDRLGRSVISTWAIKKYEENYPMVLDEGNHRLFIGYRKPPRLVVLDTTLGKAVADLEIAGDTDDLFFDAKYKRIFLTCGEGFINVIEQANPDTYNSLAKVPTAPGARTGLLVPELDLFCVAVPKRDRQPAEIRVYQITP